MLSVTERKTPQNEKHNWKICPKCDGVGKKTQKLSNKAKRWYEKELMRYEKSGNTGPLPVQPEGHIGICDNCAGSGLIPSDKPSPVDVDNYPHIAIIGGGISGVALAVAYFHRGIPFTLYERDISFDARSQGYGLTLQQANKAMESFGIIGLRDQIRTTRHLVHTPDGKIIGEWGKKKESTKNNTHKQKNVHIPRQSLRMQLLEKLTSCESVQWGYKLIDFSQNDTGRVDLTFEVNGKKEKAQTDLVVGADGIRSIVRKGLINEDENPLQYTGYMVILGICSLDEITDTRSTLLDGETVFQTVNGRERIYMMPYSQDAVMWQLSFPMPENEARALSVQGPDALKQEAIRRTPWHVPIPQVLSATPVSKITGYPVYDREILTPEQFKNSGNATLMGDAAHPMSPFKGQGANRALLDALLLSRIIYAECKPGSEWQKKGLRKTVLEKFESKMIQQSASKVQGSREAAKLLHSEAVLYDGDTPRGRGIKTK
ncbi:FAD-dependent monooxygenase [Candidatus Gracilibacteria bacterium]|nr:FAD-dependent monooxygenase [Candidatus Gracilibacteria bacterium]